MIFDKQHFRSMSCQGFPFGGWDGDTGLRQKGAMTHTRWCIWFSPFQPPPPGVPPPLLTQFLIGTFNTLGIERKL